MFYKEEPRVKFIGQRRVRGFKARTRPTTGREHCLHKLYITNKYITNKQVEESTKKWSDE